MGQRKVLLGFTNEPVSEGLHICHLYSDEVERNRVMTKFIGSGLESREKVLCLVNALTPDEMKRNLEEMGMDVSGLSALDARSAYCPTGNFDKSRMLEAIRSFYLDALDEGYQGARGAGDMAWALETHASEADLIEYEARVNQIVSDHPFTACCQYDAHRFSGQMLMDILSIHPVTIVKGQLVWNPFYIAPGDFLREFLARS